MYSEAGSLMGVVTTLPSAHLYVYRGPADMQAQVVIVHCWATVP